MPKRHAIIAARLCRRQTNLRSDIYSLGVLIAVLYKGKNVPPGDHISRGTGPWPVGVPQCSDAPPWLRVLLERMLEQNTARRPWAREVREVLLKVSLGFMHVCRYVITHCCRLSN